jgi:hypothetical protein
MLNTVMIALATITRIMNTIRKEIGLDVAGIASDASVKKTTNDNKIVIPNDSLSPHSFGRMNTNGFNNERIATGENIKTL